MTYPRSLAYNERRTIRTYMYSASLIQKRSSDRRWACALPNKKALSCPTTIPQK